MRFLKTLLLATIAVVLLTLGIFSTSAYAAASLCSRELPTGVSPIKTKQFLMLSFLKDPKTPYADIAPLIKDEAQLAWDYNSTGRIQQMYARLDQIGVVVLWNAKDKEDAEKAINQMPLVKKGFVDHTLLPVQHFSLCALFNTDTPGTSQQPVTAKPQQFVVITKPAKDATAEKITAATQAETLAVWSNYQTGIIRFMFDHSPSKPGVSAFVITANDTADAEATLKQLPFVENGLVKYQLIPVGHFFPLSALFAK